MSPAYLFLVRSHRAVAAHCHQLLSRHDLAEPDRERLHRVLTVANQQLAQLVDRDLAA